MTRVPDPTTETACAHGMAVFQERAAAFLAERARIDRLRSLNPSLPDPDRLDLTHNDYLGLRTDPAFQARARAATAGLPAGAGASRLLGGEHPVFGELERRFAAFKGAPDALFFPSGYAANEAVVVTLAQFGGRIFSDSLNHASIIDGVRLTGKSKAERLIFPHGDLDALESLLAQSPAAYNIILTESLFSMDGDTCDLARLAHLARTYDAVLVVDEAHAIGCLGPDGRGLVPAAGLDQTHLITVNTCGKALGVAGALVCGPSWFRDLLINTARPFIYTTAPSPWTAAALIAAIDYLPHLDARRTRLQEAAARVKTHLNHLGFDTGPSSTHILPVLCGSDTAAVHLADFLTRHGVHVRAIRPPTVPQGTARVRLSLHAGITDDGYHTLCTIFKKAASHHVP